MYECPIVLYKSVLIESAEQAEALPEGTVVINTRAGAIEKGSRGRWWSGLNQVPAPTVIGGSALVPIEAEEETTNRWDEGDPVNDITTKYRYVTPWEEV